MYSSVASSRRYYPGLGVAPVMAVATIASIEKKLSDVFGGKALRERYGRHAQEVLDHYNAAISNRDTSALQWLYDRSGAGDAIAVKNGVAQVMDKSKGKGWHPSEFGGGLVISNVYADGFRTLTWEYYQDAAQQLGVPEGPKGRGVQSGVRLNNIDTPVYKATNVAPIVTLTPASSQPQSQQASIFGMDLGNLSPVVLLAPLGLLALSFLLRDR
jgi:hypothetical protein